MFPPSNVSLFFWKEKLKELLTWNCRVANRHRKIISSTKTSRERRAELVFRQSKSFCRGRWRSKNKTGKTGGGGDRTNARGWRSFTSEAGPSWQTPFDWKKASRPVRFVFLSAVCLFISLSPFAPIFSPVVRLSPGILAHDCRRRRRCT